MQGQMVIAPGLVEPCVAAVTKLDLLILALPEMFRKCKLARLAWDQVVVAMVPKSIAKLAQHALSLCVVGHLGFSFRIVRDSDLLLLRIDHEGTEATAQDGHGRNRSEAPRGCPLASSCQGFAWPNPPELLATEDVQQLVVILNHVAPH